MGREQKTLIGPMSVRCYGIQEKANGAYLRSPSRSITERYLSASLRFR